MFDRTKKDWFKDLVIYQIYPKSFLDSNGDGIGDLDGIISKMDYLSSLGINAIWLSPIYSSPFADNGYDISDYRNINPLFGSLATFKEFLNEAHKRGIAVIMDLVVNHTSSEHEWFKKSVSGDEKYKDYYIWRDGKEGKEPNNWASSFGGSAWEYVEERGQYYLHLFSKGQPDLNWENEEVQKEILSMIEWWCSLGVDGFRVDAISYLEKADFSYSPNKPDVDGYAFCMDINSNKEGTHRLISKIRTEVFDKYNVFSVGEVSCFKLSDFCDYSSKERKEFDIVIPFVPPELEIKNWTPLKWKRDIKETYDALKNDGWWARFMSNHDKPRQVSLYGDDKEYREKSAILLATLNLLLPGTPFVYQGEEIGMTNVSYETIDDYDDIDTKNIYRRELSHGKEEKESFEYAKTVSRDNARSPMQWSDEENAGFSKGKPWLGVNPNYKEINVQNEEKNSNSILKYYRKLINLRQSSETLRRGELSFINFDSDVFVNFKRTLGSEEYVVLSNLSKEKNLLGFSLLGYDLVLSNYYLQRSESIYFMEPYEVVVLIKRK